MFEADVCNQILVGIGILFESSSRVLPDQSSSSTGPSSSCVGNFTECCRNLPNLTRIGLIASSGPDVHHFLARPYFPSSWLSFHFSVSASSFAQPAASPHDRLLLDRDVAILRRQLEDLVILHLHARWQQRDQRTNLESK